MPSPPRQVDRRGALRLTAGLVAVPLLVGCGPLETGDPSPGASAGEDADLLLLDQARAEATGMLALVRDTLAAHGSLRPALGPLAAMHRAHLAVLSAAGPGAEASTTPSTEPVPRRAQRALAEVRRAERAYAGALTGQALAAASGDFARILGSMAAGVTMQVAVS